MAEVPEGERESSETYLTFIPMVLGIILSLAIRTSAGDLTCNVCLSPSQAQSTTIAPLSSMCHSGVALGARARTDCLPLSLRTSSLASISSS
jgi:hypothetical protein